MRRSNMAESTRRSLPLSAFVFPDRRGWPLSNAQYATKAIKVMRMGRVAMEDAPKIIAAVRRQYPEVWRRETGDATSTAFLAEVEKAKAKGYRHHYGKTMPAELRGNPAARKRNSVATFHAEELANVGVVLGGAGRPHDPVWKDLAAFSRATKKASDAQYGTRSGAESYTAEELYHEASRNPEAGQDPNRAKASVELFEYNVYDNSGVNHATSAEMAAIRRLEERMSKVATWGRRRRNAGAKIELPVKAGGTIAVPRNRVSMNWADFPYDIKGTHLWIISHEFGPMGAVWASNLQDALDELVDQDLAGAITLSEKDAKRMEKEDPDSVDYLGNDGVPVSTYQLQAYTSADEVDLKPVRDKAILDELEAAYEAGQDFLDDSE